MSDISDHHFSLAMPFVPGTVVPSPAANDRFFFIFYGEELLVKQQQSNIYSLPSEDQAPAFYSAEYSQYFGRYGQTDCFVVATTNRETGSDSLAFLGLRALFGKMEADLFTLAGRALQILHWHREHRFCGKCGSTMEQKQDEIAKICPTCGFVGFPRVSPAVIMAVTRGDSILLARAPHFPREMYSTLAGFVEPGETLEEAVRREVMEEVSLKLGDIRYVTSQPWPFPHSIMIGFTAEYAGGTLQIDNREIVEAAWFPRTQLPRIPSRQTIARLLIDTFVQAKP